MISTLYIMRKEKERNKYQNDGKGLKRLREYADELNDLYDANPPTDLSTNLDKYLYE